jgi:predicted nucleic acid-binding protein
MKIVIDTSVIISVITNEKHKNVLINITKGAILLAPESIQYEIGNAFSAMLKRNRITIENTKRALREYDKIPIQFYSIDLERAINISYDLKIYAYDAYFIECAASNRLPLLSIDDGLIRAAQQYGIKIIEV